MYILFTLLIAVIGGTLALKIKLPAGAIVGSIIAVSVVNIVMGLPEMPGVLKWFTQVIAGAFIGSGLTSKSVSEMKKLTLPAIILITTFMVINILLGFALYFTSPLDLCTSLFAVVPGGLSEMSVIADDMGADTAVVSVFQVARLTSTMCLFPFLITRILHAEKNNSGLYQVKNDIVPLPQKSQRSDFALSLLIAAAAGTLGQISGFPGGILLFSVTATGFLKIKTDRGFMPKTATRLAQILTGAYIGAKVTRSVAGTIVYLWPYVIVFVFLYFIFCLLAGFIMSRITKIDRITAVFSCTPAGASDMALIASEFVTTTPTIATLQLVRMVGIIAIFPSMIALILRLYP
ncbi:MAG: AbrB family transcriptional regulator [Pseudomonadota bacterium]